MARIGIYGMGTMGAALALNMAEKGFAVAIHNRRPEPTQDVVANAGPLAERLTPCESLDDFVNSLEQPRSILLMIKSGAPVDSVIDSLVPHLAKGDLIIDAGNADFNNTRRRATRLEDLGISFLGVGVSGGEEGARHGPSIMVGGSARAYERVADIIAAIAAKFKGNPCADWLGPDGAGHFVKTVHNGIEYADMQLIAEVYGLVKADRRSMSDDRRAA